MVRRGASLTWPLGLTVYIFALSAISLGSSVRGLPWWYQLLVAMMPVISVTCLWLTNQMDPGIIPPCSERDATIELLEDGHTIEGHGKDTKGRWTRKVPTQDGHEDLEKYCMKCNVWRPGRGYHCEECGFCMDRGDHHCGVVGNCVAKNNHRFFAAFLCTAWVGAMLMMCGSIWRLKSGSSWREVESYFLVILAVIYGYHALMLIFGLMHLVGLILDLTTKDIGSEDGDCEQNLPCAPGKRNPKALYRSWRAVCCAPVTWRSSLNEIVPQRLPSHDMELAGGPESGSWAPSVQLGPVHRLH